MYSMENVDQNEFHYQMLQKYFSIFQKIETESLTSSVINSLSHQVKGYHYLTDEEKKLHQSFLSELQKLSEEIKTLHWMSKHLKVLHELGQTFSHTFDKEQIYEKAYELVSRVMDTDAFVIALYNEGDQEFQIPFSVDNGVRYESVIYPLGKGIISKVLQSKETIHIRSEDEFEKHGNKVQWGNPDKDTETCIFVPMILNNKIKGVISAQNYHKFAYGSEHEELLRIIGIQVASAIETARLYDKVYDLSVKDEVTNIKNSRKFHLDLEEKMKSNSEGDAISLMMLDSDNLKQVNDQFGHHMGDRLIKYISNVLLQFLDEGEEAYRYAGDEFMIISPKSNEQELLQKAHRIQQHLINHPIVYQDQEIITTISIGVAQYPKDTTNGDELKRLADIAMYRSKKSGKNRVTFYSHLQTV